MAEWDVIVVGCGPAGLTAAKTAAENGLEVLCLEKKQEIGVPVRCAEGIGLGVFKNQNIPIKKEYCVWPIEGAALYAPSGKKVEIRFNETSGYIVERRIFEKFLAREAAKEGAKIKVKSNVIKAERINNKVKVHYEHFDEIIEEEAKIIISAEGVEAKIARQLGINTVNKLNDIDSGFQYEMAGIEFEQPELIHLYFGREVAYRGYVWIFPKGKNEANVGVGVGGLAPEKAKVYLDRFIEKHEGLKRGSIIAVNAGGIPVGGFLENMAKDNLLVCGDAAHQVNPIHGGGIGLAIEAANIAAKVAAEAIKQKNYSEEFLSRYNKLWYEQRGNKLKRILKMRHMMENLSDKDFETIAESLSGEDIMKIAEGDILQSAKIVSSKLVENPGLVKIMLKYLQS